MANLPKLIVFDMDGVVTSERGYWNASTLTVADILYSPDKIAVANPEWSRAESLPACLKAANALMPDSVIASLKAKAINTNWDLTVIVLAWHLLHLLKVNGKADISSAASFFSSIHAGRGLGDSEELSQDFYRQYPHATGYEILKCLDDDLSSVMGGVASLFDREGWLWKEAFELFQKWFLGGIEKNGIRLEGLIQGEEPVVPLKGLKDVFNFLKTKQIPLGIATGRTRYEIETPLKRWGLIDYFSPDHFVTHDEVLKGEGELKRLGIHVPLSKPHPFPFLRAIYPKAAVLPLHHCEYNISNHADIWIVGDTVGDIRGGRQIGCRTIGVLTGVAGKGGRVTLKDAKVDDILDSILDLPDLIMGRS